MKKKLIIALILTIILSSVGFDNFSFASTGNKDIYEGKSKVNIPFKNIEHQLPSGTKEHITVKGQKIHLNTELWNDKGIVVYGDYTLVNPSASDYKKGTQNPNGKPYYKSGEGEYRYHGFDATGNKYTNIDFINDANSSTALAQKRWIYRPWNNNSLTNNEISHFNWIAIEDKNVEVQRWINNSFSWNIENGTSSDRNKYNYLLVQTAPTIQTNGEGRMWHISANTGRTWYQTFSINKLQNKQHLPVKSEIKIRNKDKLLLGADMPILKLQLDVSGILEDDLVFDKRDAQGRLDGGKYDEVEKTIYYHRHDIKNWNFRIVGSGGFSHTIKLENMRGHNKASRTVDVEIPREVLENNPNLKFDLEVFIDYLDNSKSNTAKSSDTAKVNVEEGKGLKSYFTITRSVLISKEFPFTSSLVRYRDSSMGDIVKYEMDIVNLTNSESTQFTVNTNKINDSTVNQAFYNLASGFLADKDSGSYDFKVTQVITDKKGKTDTHTEMVTILFAQKPPVYVDPDCQIPDLAFDIVPFKPTDNTDMADVKDKVVYVDGNVVDYDYFFSGDFIFGESDVDRILQVIVIYTSTDDHESMQSKWVRVLTTKPKVQYKLDGTFKENRKLTIQNNSDTANSPILLQHYPITYHWRYLTIDGDSSSRRMRDMSDLYKELMYKKQGVYAIELIGTNELGRTSDPYILEFPIAEDYAPVIEFYLWNNVLTRGEAFQIHHFVTSTEEDIITRNDLEIWYDSNDDGEYDTLLKSMKAEDFTEYKPDKLGSYKIINYVEEDFGQPTLEEFISPSDKRSRVVEREFFVENLAPMTTMYVDIPLDFPEIDVFIMTDRQLDRSKNDLIRNSRIDYANYLRQNSIVPKVEVWDLHTYVHSQSASTSYRTGTSYPPSTYHYSSGGYSGTLSRNSVSDNGGNQDFGKYVGKQESRSFSDSHYNTVTTVHDYTGGGTSTSHSSPAPDSKPINSDGFVGSIPRTGSSQLSSTSDEVRDDKGKLLRRTVVQEWVAYYSGTLTKTVQIWESDWRWVSDYIGFYSGTVYNYVKQQYVNPFRTLSDKYVVYVSDGTLNDLTDLQMVLNRADTKLILVGNESIKSQIPHDYFFKNDRDIQLIMYDVLQKIVEDNPYELAYKILWGEEFNFDVIDLDEENDPIVKKQFQYVQDPDYFDNSKGKDSFTSLEFNESNWITTKHTKFNTKGFFEIYRRIKDEPVGKESYGLYSNTPKFNLIVHEKPIALATLDWTYNTSRGLYETTWVDLSYDPDFQYSREDKGIVERKIMYRRNGGEWIYRIPDELQHGSYELMYYVKDVHGAWSDPFTMNFTLSATPPIQFDAKATTVRDDFSLASIPASEKLLAYDIWTRYPYNSLIRLAIYNNTTRVTNNKDVYYSTSTGTKNGSDIYWNDIDYTIPETLADGNYIFKVSAVDTNIQSIKTDKDFNVTVRTPINLIPEISGKVTADRSTTIKAQTSKYANSVVVTLFKGTAYARNVTLSSTTNGDLKSWQNNFTGNRSIPEGTYVAEYVARTPNGNVEVKTLNFQYVYNSPPTISINRVLPSYIYEGDNVSAEITVNDPDLDTLILELELYKDSTKIWSNSKTVNPVGSTYPLLTENIFNNIEVGNYQLRARVIDPYNEVATATRNFTVNALGITGYVSHTDDWDKNRKAFNVAKSGNENSPRTYDTFFGGEKFILSAETTQINSNSSVVANSVRVEIIGTTYDTGLNKRPNGYQWNGSLWDEAMIRWTTRNVTFRFTVTYSNGTVKTDDVTIRIDNDEKFWRLHRKY